MNYKLIIPLLFASFLSNAQSTTPITKKEVLAKVQKNNHTIKIAQQNVLMAKGDYNQTNAVLLPNITFSHTGITTTNPLMAFGSKLNQEILSAADFNPALLNNPDQVQNFATKIEVQQPLLNFDGLYQRKAAKLKWDATQLQATRTQDYMLLEVEKAYMQLQLAYKTVVVLEQAEKTALENKRLANNALKQGYLQKADVLAVDVRVLEIQNQLQTGKSNIENASNYLSILMNEDVSQILKPTDELTATITTFKAASVSENRADIQAMNLASEAYQKMHKANKMAFLPRLNAFGSYELYDNHIFQGRANGYLVGAQLSWKLLEGSKRFGKKAKSQAEYDKSLLQKEQYVAQSNLELYKASRMFKDAKSNLKLSELALKQSKEVLRTRTNRFQQGLEKTTDLLLAETQYSQKQLAYYATVFKHNFAGAYMQFLMSDQ